MLAVYALIYIPILLFVAAFLYETYLSFARLKEKRKGRGHYVDTTWEVTHTLLIFGVVMMLMLYTKYIDQIATAILIPAFLAMTALFVRGACYIYIFYIAEKKGRRWVDWLFALSHVFAALFLVAVVGLFTLFLATNNPSANTQFIPAFSVGLIFIMAIVTLPLVFLYWQQPDKK